MGLVVPYRSTGVGVDYTEFSADIIGFGAGTDINVILSGVTFHLQGDGNNPHNRFNPMTATMEIVNDRDAVTDFISAMSSYAEEEFFCKITKNGTLVFIGSVTADGGEWQDIARVANPTYKLIAYDGMGRMQGKNYSDEEDNPYTGYATIPEVIFRCMEKTGTADQFSGTFFAIVHDNVEDSQVVSGDPLGNQRIDQAIFYEIGQDTGTYNYKTCEEVLEYIMVAYNLCLRYVGPYFLFYNPAIMESGATAYAYSAGGSYTGNISVGSDISILDDKSLDANRKGISNFGALPPLYKARITYDHGPQDVNMLHGISYSGYNHYADPGPDGSMIDLGPITVPVTELVHLRFSGKLRMMSEFYGGTPPPRWKNHRYWFKIKLKVEWGGHEMWWYRNVENYDFYATTFSSYSQADWYQDSGQEEYDWVSEILDERNADVNHYKNIGFDTKPIVSGYVNHVYFGFEVVHVFDEKEAVIDLGDNPNKCWWEFSDLKLEALAEGDLLKRPTKTVSEALTSYKNASYLDETTIIGDGPGKTSPGRIQVYDGSEWRDSALWGGQKLHLKSVNEIVSSRHQALKKLLGGFYALNAWFDTFVTYNGIIYWPLEVRYVSGNDDWDGIWVEVGSAGGTITLKEKKVLSREKLDLPLGPRLPDDEELQWRITIPQTKEAHTTTGGPYTNLEMRSPAPRNLWRKGDIVNITDPVIGWVNELTLTQDVLKDDTFIYFQSWTPTVDFPPGSYLELNKLAEIQDGGENITIYRYHEGFSGSSIDVIDDMTGDDVTGLNGTLLPDESHEDMTRAIYAKRVEVYKNGQKLMYLLNVDTGTQYDRGFYGTRATDTIHFYEPCVLNTIEIYIKKIYKED